MNHEQSIKYQGLLFDCIDEQTVELLNVVMDSTLIEAGCDVKVNFNMDLYWGNWAEKAEALMQALILNGQRGVAEALADDLDNFVAKLQKLVKRDVKSTANWPATDG